jgi:adenylate kinase family enzyme
MNYYQKYNKYKVKYLNSKNNCQSGGNGKLIIHITGSQGSGKSTLGNKLKDKYGNKIHIYDLDDLHNEYSKISSKFNDNYQEYINQTIKTNISKPLIFVGLDAELCLGLMEDSDIVYELQADHKFYIESTNETLKQRFFRQIDKLENRKEWFFDEWIKKPEETQNKLFRFVDLNKCAENNKKCDELYKNREYKFMNSNDIYEKSCEILDTYFL